MKAIDDIEKLLNAMRDRGAEMQAFEALLTEIGGSLADIVGIMEQKAAPTGSDSEALSKALIAGLAKIKPPSVAVNVAPTPVQVNVASPVVTVTPSEWKSLRVTVNKSANGNKEFKITKE